MDEYITKKQAIEACYNRWNSDDITIQHIHHNIESLPASNVREVVYGHWISHRIFLECSVCGEIEMLENNRNFCPNCGADMR